MFIRDEELPQGTSAWLEWKKAGIGSSAIATILGVNPYKNAHELYLEMIGEKPPEDISKKYAVQRGTALEPFARKLFNETVGKNFQPACFIHPEHSHFRYSSDGYCDDTNELIEIKCLGKTNHSKVVTENKVLDYYMPQCQYALLVSGADLIYFVCYNPSLPNPMFYLLVEKDIPMFKYMTEAAHSFWSCVQRKTWDFYV